MNGTKFWHQKWQANEIGFHQAGFHQGLEKYWRRLKLKRRSAVFVPMCGKSKDMLFLKDNSHDVIGVELSEIAATAFFKENCMKHIAMQKPDFNVLTGSGISLLVGDFFNIKPYHLRTVRAVYDRAALIALPPKMREQYSAHLKSILAPDTQILLITLEYAKGQVEGPPFSVSESEVEKLFGSWCTIEKSNFTHTELFKDKVEVNEALYIIRVEP